MSMEAQHKMDLTNSLSALIFRSPERIWSTPEAHVLAQG